MPTFVIERDTPAVGKLTDAELKAAAARSCTVISDMQDRVRWQHSYVTGDRIYCIYEAPNEAAIKEHAELSGFPASRISVVGAVISPDTAK